MTKITLRSAVLAATALIAVAVPAYAKSAPAVVAAAPASTGTVVAGLGTANLEEAAGRSNAYTVAAEQRKITYKATYDSALARNNALTTQLRAMIDAYNVAVKKPGATPALMAPQAKAINDLKESGQREIQQILMPAQLSEAYVNEQISDKLDAAVQAAMTKRGVTLLLNPQAVLARSNAYDLTSAITAELNASIPAAQLVPPQGWLPREYREAQAQQAAAAAAASGAPAPRPAAPATDGR